MTFVTGKGFVPVCGPDYSFTIESGISWLFRCAVSSLCTFLLPEAWLKITISFIC